MCSAGIFIAVGKTINLCYWRYTLTVVNHWLSPAWSYAMQIILGKGERRTIAETTLFYKMFHCLCPKVPKSSSGLSQLHSFAHTVEEAYLWEILLKGKDKIIASSRRVEIRLPSSSEIQEHKKQYRKTKAKKEEVVKGERRIARIIW